MASWQAHALDLAVRFTVKRKLKNQTELAVVRQILGRGELPAPTWQMERDELESLFRIMGKIYLPMPVSRYIARVVSATHPGSAEATGPVNKYITYGASPRAGIAIAEAARAHALLNGRPSVGFEDVKAVAQSVLNHRLILNYQARFDRMTAAKIVTELLGQLDETGLNLPKDVELAAT